MVWGFAEANPMSSSTGNFMSAVDWIVEVLLNSPRGKVGYIKQETASKLATSRSMLISTDPPYYDMIGYADLSDFFYVWLRRSLNKVYPSLFSTMAVPKVEELVATPYRFGGNKDKAKEFFENGLTTAFEVMSKVQNPDYPLTVYYAFKQSESDESATENDGGNGEGSRASTGWETMLESLLRSNFSILGTWPMRTELSNRAVAKDTNSLASSIVLVCRPLPKNTEKTTRRNFIGELKKELPSALKKLQHGYIPPVDLSQAAIGPGMAIFSRYSGVLEADGKRMPVRTALQLINQVLDEVLLEQDSDYDVDTRWAVAWFEQFGFSDGQFGDAEVLSKAKDTALDGLVASGILQSKGGKVRLLRSNELTENWNPDTDKRLTVWEITHYLSRYLEEGGIDKAAPLMKQLGSRAESGQELAYRLFGICERKKWSEYALAYNNLVVAWPDIKHAAASLEGEPKQLALEV
jgi:putative DNA methylase